MQSLIFNPSLATPGELPRRGKRRPLGGGAAEKMEPQRASYFAGFAARRHAATGKFRPFFRGGASVLCKAKLEKVAFSHFFDSLCFPLIIGITL